jgi:hypothetical protein
MATATKNMQKSGDQNRSQGDRSQGNNSPAKQAHHMTQDVMDYLRDYARERPEAAALWCLGIGFVLGWKLKPW